MNPGQHLRIGRLRRAVALVALATALIRGFIPVGFMPASVHGTVQLMFCDGGGHHHPDGAPSDHGPAGHHGADQGPCPFALSGAAPLLPGLVPVTVVAATVEEPATAATFAARRDAPPRYSAPRGPPTRA